MSQIPPGDAPPPQDPQYVPYFRGTPTSFYGSPERLQALADGYFGLNLVFLLNVLLNLAFNGVLRGFTSVDMYWPTFFIMIGAMFVIITFASYAYNKKVGIGMGWSPTMPAVVSLLMGLNSALCCGIIGYIAVQMIAMGEIKRYGLKVGSFSGLKKRDVAAKIAEMRSMPAPPPGPGFQA